MRLLQAWLEKLRKRSNQKGFVCDVCGAEVFTYPKHRLCEECESSLYVNDGHFCPKCGRKTVTEGVCLTCKRHKPAFTLGFSPFVYFAKTAGYINRIKNGNRRLACFFGERMADKLLSSYPHISDFEAGRYAMNDGNSSKALLVIPVPMTEKGLKTRGYNQALDLAEELTERLLALGYAVELDQDVLQKRKETAQQKHMHFQQRMENVSGAYHVHKRSVCKDRVIVLVDDIMTTGATGDECAKRLLNVGAKEVLFLTAAALPEQK